MTAASSPPTRAASRRAASTASLRLAHRLPGLVKLRLALAHGRSRVCSAAAQPLGASAPAAAQLLLQLGELARQLGLTILIERRDLGLQGRDPLGGLRIRRVAGLLVLKLGQAGPRARPGDPPAPPVALRTASAR